MARAQRQFNWEMLVALTAIFTSVVAVGVALYSAKVDRDYARMAVWPYLLIGLSGTPSVFSDEEIAAIESGEATAKRNHIERAIVVLNRGMGPAVVQYASLRDAAGSYANWTDYLERGLGLTDGGMAGQSHFGSGVIPAGELIQALRVTGPRAVTALNTAGSDTVLEICYCSVYQECWISRLGSQPFSVDSCDIDDADRFLQ